MDEISMDSYTSSSFISNSLSIESILQNCFELINLDYIKDEEKKKKVLIEMLMGNVALIAIIT